MNTSGSLSRRRFLVSSLGLGAATIASSASPGLLRGASAQGGEIWYTLSDGTRLRSGPGLSYPIVSTLSAGTRVSAFEQARVADGLDWTRVTVSVQSDVLEGYVASKFFSPNFQEAADPRFPIGSDFFVEAGTGQGGILRAEPGLTRVVGTVVSGTRGKILSNPVRAGDLRWFRVDIDGKWAYLVSDVMIPGAGGIAGPGFQSWPVGTRVVVSDGPLHLRDRPRGRSLGTYRTGTRATTTGKPALMANGEDIAWYPVRMADGRRGYVASNFLRRA